MCAFPGTGLQSQTGCVIPRLLQLGLLTSPPHPIPTNNTLLLTALDGTTLLISTQGHYVALACSRHGSRVLDAIWSGAALGARKEIAAELGECLVLTFPNVLFTYSEKLNGWEWT